MITYDPNVKTEVTKIACISSPAAIIFKYCDTNLKNNN